MKNSFFPLFSLLLLVAASPVLAQIQSPRLLNESLPGYPGLHDREALVELEFTVNSAGGAEAFAAVGGFHEPRFVEAAISAVGAMTFAPAMRDGEAVDWPGYRVTARFIIEDLFNTVQPIFSASIRQVEALVAAQDYDAAERLARELRDTQVKYLFEYAYVNLRLSEIYLLQDRLFDAARVSTTATLSYLPGEHRNYGIESAKLVDTFNVLTISQFSDADVFNDLDVNTTLAVQNAVTSPLTTGRPPHLRSGLRFSNRGSDLGDKITMDVLNPGLMQDALQAGIQIHGRLGHLRAMHNDVERYRTVNPRVPDFLSRLVTIADELLAQGAPLQSMHRVDAGEALFFPTRRILTAANVSGSLAAVDFQCERRTTRLDYTADADWQIPASWGECAVRFLGESGTTFSVIEFE